jgi:hypothetical protein
MRMRLVPWVALLGLALLPGAARPDEATPAKPSIILRLASVDSLKEDVRYLGELAGQEEIAKQIEVLIKQRTGPKGIEGLDTKRPIGAYANIGPTMGLDSTGVVLLPIADEQDFMALLERLGSSKPEKDGDVYTANIEGVPFPIYFRFAEKYCYLTLKDRDSIDKDKLLAPAALLGGAKAGTLSVTVNIDRIPTNLKNAALSQIDLQLAKVKEKQGPNETSAQAKLKGAILDEVSRRLKSLLREGGPIDLRVNLDRGSNDLTLSASLAGKPDSALAADIANLGKVQSMAAALVGRDSALSGLLDVALPDKLRSVIGPVIDEGEKKVLDKQQDNPAKRDILAAILSAVKPTLKNGEVDAGFDLRGPNDSGIYTAVAGVKVKDGEEINKTLHKIVSDLPAEVQELIKLDFDKLGGAVVHRLTARGDVNRDIPLGDNPVYVAVRDDAVLIAAGDGGLTALKDALGSTAKPSRLGEFQMSVSRLAPLMEKENKGAVEAARKVFGKDKDADKVRITLEGGPALQLRLVAKTQLLKFFSLLDSGKKADQ